MGLDELIVTLPQRFQGAVCRHTTHHDGGKARGCRGSVSHDDLRAGKDFGPEGFLVWGAGDGSVDLRGR